MTEKVSLCPPDQPGPDPLLIGWFPVAGLPVLPPQAAAEGKGGQRPEGGPTGDAGPQQRRDQRPQTSQQRRRCRGGVKRLRVDGWGGGIKGFVVVLKMSTSKLRIQRGIFA